MKRFIAAGVICLAVAGVVLAQVSDRLGVQDMRYGNSWDRDLGTISVEIKGITPINVQGFPFDADGSDGSNDEVAIQAAIDSAYSWGGGTVYLPAGTYYVGGNGYVDSVDSWCLRLKSNVTIMGDGPATVIKLYAQKGRDVQPNGYPVSHVFYTGKRTWAYPTQTSGQATGERVYEDLIDTTHVSTNGEVYASNIEIRDLCIDTDYENQPSASGQTSSPISINSATNVRVINCKLTGAVSTAANFYGNHPDSSTTNIIFSGNIVSEAGEDGVGGIGATFDRVDGILCTNNVFKDIGLRAVVVTRAYNAVVANNEIRDVYDDGIRCIGGTFVSITGNHMHNVGQYGVQVGPNGSSFSVGVSVTDNNLVLSATSGECGVLVLDAQRVHVSGNVTWFPHWDGTGASSYIGGIYVANSDTLADGTAWTREISVIGNSLYSTDEVYSDSGDTLNYAPAAIQLVNTVSTYESRPQHTMVANNFSSWSFDGFRVVNFDSVAASDNYFANVVRTGLDTTNVGWLGDPGYFFGAAAGDADRDSTGSKDDYHFTSPED